MKESSPEHIEIARVQMHKAVWGYLNAILPSNYTDAQINAATEAFIEIGMFKTASDLGAYKHHIIAIGDAMAAANDRAKGIVP